jgi:ADP-heptose:LPS heptosyltransferase
MMDGARIANVRDGQANTFLTMRLKRLELWWRRLWIRLLVGLMRRSSDERPDWASRRMRVLFLRHDRAGDMILSTGVMRAIARSHPTITLDVLASPANADILAASDYVHEVVVFDKRRLASYAPVVRRLRRAKYDAVIDCMVTAPSVTTLLLIAASGARHRVGISGRGNDSAFTVLVPANDRPGAHMVDLLAALAPAFGATLDETQRRPVLDITAAERERADAAWGERAGPRVLINISAGTNVRIWANDRYAAVMRHIRGRDSSARLLVISAPWEAARGREVAAAGGAIYVSTATLRHMIALVATADFVLTPDTSVAHVASAFRRPAVAMYVRGKRDLWRVYDTPSESIEHSGETLADLPVEPVIAAVDRVWDSAPVAVRVR